MITRKDFKHPQTVFWDVCILQAKVTLAKELVKFWLLRRSQCKSLLGMLSPSSAQLAQASQQDESNIEAHFYFCLRKSKRKEKNSAGLEPRCWYTLLFQRIEVMLLWRVLHPRMTSVYLPCSPQPGFLGSGLNSTESRIVLFCWAQWYDSLARCLHCLCNGSVPTLLCQEQKITTLMFWY